MSDKNEPKTYWEKRCWINEQVLEQFMAVVAGELPSIARYHSERIDSWIEAIDALDKDAD